MEFTELNKLPGIFLFIDFEKAFDTLEWPFVQHALKFFNFGPNIRKWISVLYNDAESGVITARGALPFPPDQDFWWISDTFLTL